MYSSVYEGGKATVTTQAIGVIVDLEKARKGNGKLPAYAAPYIGEILRHAGIPFDVLPPDALVAGHVT